MAKVDISDEEIFAIDADEYRVMFSFELDTDTCELQLGGYLCLPWPAVVRGLNRQTLKAADALTSGKISRLINIAAEFARYTKLRATMDNKCKGPYVLVTDFPMARGEFERYLSGMTNKEIRTKFIQSGKYSISGVPPITSRIDFS